MKFWHLVIVGIVTAAAAFFWPSPKITIGTTSVKVSVADSAEARQLGLSGRENLAEDEGMLFVFEQPGRYGFWMKEMKFDLDFIWINDDRVVDINESVPAPKTGELPVTIRPQAAADKVLEVGAGFIKQNNIKIGDVVKY